MTTLVLVRHATTAATGRRLGGRTQASLNDAGREQARGAAQRLAEVPLRAVYSSPLPRSMETAELVAEAHGLAVRPCQDVVEIEYGRWTDRPLKPLLRTKLWPVIQSTPSLVGFPDGETIRAMQQRAVDALEELVVAHRNDAIAVVSHADVIKAVVAFYLGLPLDLFQRLVIGPASVTVLQLAPGARPSLLRMGDDGPLTADRFARPPTRAPRRAARRPAAKRSKERARG